MDDVAKRCISNIRIMKKGKKMYIETRRLILRNLEENEKNQLLDYLQRNREFLKEWEPVRGEAYYTIENMKTLINDSIIEENAKQGLGIYIFKKDEPSRIIGNIHFSSLVYGVFLSCFLGYKLDVDEVGKGYMTEGLDKAIQIFLDDYGMHRIEANIIPRNMASKAVVKKLGFKCEGSSPRYLKINGTWEDHEHYVLLNPKVE